MSTETEVPMLADYFILSLMRLDRDHCQRVEAVRSVTGDDMEIFLFAPHGELEDLILDYLGFPGDGTPIKGGGKFSRNAGMPPASDGGLHQDEVRNYRGKGNY